MFYSIREVDYHDLGKFRFHIETPSSFVCVLFLKAKVQSPNSLVRR